MADTSLKASTLLNRLQLFRNVDIDSIAECISQCSFISLDQGQQLLSPLEENHSIYLMISGRMEVYLNLQEKNPLTLVAPGECVGEMSIIEGKKPSAYVLASEPSEVMQIPEPVLWKMIDSSHQVTRNMLHIMSLRVRFSNLVVSDSLGTQKECMRRATIDALTGLHNRRWMDNMFEQEFLHAKREGMPVALMMLDIDHFKQYNDQFGHVVGDRVLSSVANTLRASLRPNDMIARYGGEEFSIMLAQTQLDAALELAEVLRQKVGVMPVANEKAQDLPQVTLSIGVASLSAQQQLMDLIEQADKALYKAKQQGRNCVCH